MPLFNTKLAWLTRNLSLFHKICNGNGPIIIFPYYVNYGKSSHGHYNSRTSRKNDPITPKCKKSSGPRTFNSSVTGLWNGTETYLRDVLHSVIFLWRPFKKTSKDKGPENAVNEHFNINYIYCMDNQVCLVQEHPTIYLIATYRSDYGVSITKVTHLET